MQKRVAVDTNVIVAAHLVWHERHQEALAALEDALERGRLLLSVHTLLEAYAVMTRLPAPHRLHPRDAYRLLYDTFYKAAEIGWLDETELWRLLEMLKEQGLAGGKTYDAYILACAIKVKADTFVTFNRRDFEIQLSDDETEIIEPASKRR
jgi:predicted nucleic acid-binding protein